MHCLHVTGVASNIIVIFSLKHTVIDTRWANMACYTLVLFSF